jgi:hypothetical protein
VERSADAYGASVAGRLAGATFIVFGERGAVRERIWNLQQLDPPTDRWDATSMEIGAAASARLPGERFEVNGRISRTGVEGESFLRDFEQRAFHADEQRLDARVEVRGGFGATRAALVLRATQDRRERTDELVDVAVELDAWSTTVAAEVAHAVWSGISLSAGGAYQTFRTGGSIPNFASPGAEYGRWVGPDLAYAATGADATSAAVTAAWSPPQGRAQVFGQLRVDGASPSGTVRLPFGPQPTARRSATRFVVGVTLP